MDLAGEDAPRDLLGRAASTMHVVPWCNNHRFYSTTLEDFRVLLEPSPDPRDPRWGTRLAVGSPASVACYEIGVTGRLPRNAPCPER